LQHSQIQSSHMSNSENAQGNSIYYIRASFEVLLAKKRFHSPACKTPESVYFRGYYKSCRLSLALRLMQRVLNPTTVDFLGYSKLKAYKPPLKTLMQAVRYDEVNTQISAHMTRVCYVPDNLGGHIHMRFELASLKQKFNDLENLCKDMTTAFGLLSQGMSVAVSEVKDSVEKSKHLATSSFAKRAPIKHAPADNRGAIKAQPYVSRSMNPFERSNNPPRGPARNEPISRPGYIGLKASTPLIDQENRKLYSEVLGGQSQVSSDNWHFVTRKKPKKPIVVKGAAKSTIKTVKAVHVSSFFLSRCEPETTCEEIKTNLETQNSWSVKEVSKMNTRFNTYASFRVDIIRNGEHSENSYMKPDHWPADSLVKRFNRKFGPETVQDEKAPSSMISLLTWNCQGFKSNGSWLQQHITNYDIIAVQETWLHEFELNALKIHKDSRFCNYGNA